MYESTIVSIVPWEIIEDKVSIYPSNYKIPAAPKGEFSVLHVGEAQAMLYQLDNKQMAILIPSYEVARGIVEDYHRAQLQSSSDASPGLFFVPEKLGPTEITKKCQDQLKEAQTKQNNWFKKLVFLADDDWAKFKQRKMITDIQRFAAVDLLLDREWLTVVDEKRAFCPSCATEIRDTAIKCLSCGFILKPEEYQVLVSQGRF